ncbi:hypothetical protein MB27_12650 [Actinoplanes utahensis]|uniref:AAA+ ATPase domain-containing protein n=2 Tax=Actinoplanes utahensis TaxID=1869 RepID=A0A0A6UQE5_ACTUT|nr:hypothetical protein MB27_12650 [Actinoplanes utahensis]
METVEHDGRVLSGNALKSLVTIGERKVREVWAARCALPPARFLELAGALGADHPGVAELRERYLAAYGHLYASAGLETAELEEIGRLAPATAGDSPPGAAATAVATVTQRNLDEANNLLVTGSRARHELRLADLYVPRVLGAVTEDDLLARCAAPSTTLIVGEPGAGKTSLLWRLATRLRERQPVVALSAEELSSAAVTVEQIAHTLAAASPRVTVLLIDTVDLLLRGEVVPDVLTALLRLAKDTGAVTVMTCREQESFLLRRRGDDLGLTVDTLGPYDGRELRTAIRGHAQHFLAGAVRDPDALAATVENAVTRGLPIAEICRRPLTLRMLFELALLEPGDAVHGDQDAIRVEIDMTDLFDRHWLLRVVTDRRRNAGGAEEPDASPAAEFLAVLMVASGRLRLSETEIGIEWQRAGRGQAGILDAVAALRRRHVLHGAAETLEYFHQIFFEYACARALIRMPPAAIEELVDRTIQLNDPFLAAITQQVLIYACRSTLEAARLDPIFAKLLSARHDGIRRTAIAAYAQARFRGPQTVAVARRLLEPPEDPALQREAGLVKRYMEFLPRVRHEDTVSALEDLACIWRWEPASVKKVVVAALAALAASYPERVSSFVESERIDCFGWFEGLTGEQARVLRGGPLLLVERLAAADRAWARGKLLDLARKVCEGTSTHDALAAVLTTAATIADGHGDLRDFLAAEFIDIPTKTSGIDALNPALAAIHRSLWLSAGRSAGELLDDIIAADESQLSRRARLWALAEITHACPPDVVEDVLTRALAVQDRRLQAEVCDYLLVRLLQGPYRLALAGAPQPATTPASKIARERCVAGMRSLPLTGGERVGGLRRPGILWRDALEHAGLPPDEIASVMKQIVEPADANRSWLRPDAFAAFLAPAAVGGHDGAAVALNAWARRSRPARGEQEQKSRTIIVTRLRGLFPRHPAVLGQLIADGRVENDGSHLARLINDSATGHGAAPAENAASVAELAYLLRASPVEHTRRDGYVLLRWAARAGEEVEAGAVVTGLRDENREEALNAVLALLETVLDIGEPTREWTWSASFEPIWTALTSLTPPTGLVAARVAACLRELCCVAGPLDPEARPRTIATVRDLLLRTDDPETLAPLRTLLIRLAAVDPVAAARLLVETSTVVASLSRQGTTDSWKSRRGHRLRPGIAAVVEAADFGEWKRTLRGLAPLDPTIFSQAIDLSIRRRSASAEPALIEETIDRILADVPQGPRVVAEYENSKARQRRITGTAHEWPVILDRWRSADTRDR